MTSLRIALVEDEPVTARNLAHMLQSLDENIRIVTMLRSVKEATAWFSEQEDGYDLAFMDIRLADGLSFDIFKKVSIHKPVIFVTAYNDYAIEAFKNNGIDYILKPFDEAELQQSLQKYESLVRPTATGAQPNPAKLAALLEQLESNIKPYKRSFLVHHRDKLVPVETNKIAWCYTAHEIVYAHTQDNRQYIMEFTMEQLEQQLDPSLFFRANRQFIVNRQVITEVDFYFNGRLLVKVKPEPTEPILISKARVPEFKSWMNH
ncbi:two component transcriptional regulator, LytTR family [Chitinophaga costaii]|uniref:Two component transcriptional regulator, LytTR family n=1 Tax=Chitinophaga costaii TaxID=1335309 RepID=A0A1C4EZY4_9BACT|nr:LytTR family DNA-binding domain-containing protein [Chitinophaga costaii]PUZ21512.1 DNA-binding response regulator [Chitinophaga costaii]SCC49062.1 two component transcriptional regulator, LytTR family [Chitinophaga costaii]